MNLQRREEIRAMANWLDSSEWSGATEYQDAMRELLAHIDTLEQTAAERVIADGMFAKIHKAVGVILSDPTIEMNETALHDALGGEFVRIKDICVKVGAGPTPDYTGEGSAWVPPVGAPTVVVPEISGDILQGIASFDDYAAQRINMDATAESVTEWFRKNARALRANQGGDAT